MSYTKQDLLGSAVLAAIVTGLVTYWVTVSGIRADAERQRSESEMLDRFSSSMNDLREKYLAEIRDLTTESLISSSQALTTSNLVLEEIQKTKLAIVESKQTINAYEEYFIEIQNKYKGILKVNDGTIDLQTIADASVPSVIEALNLPGAVVPFALETCPTGWQEYSPAYGRFVRGVDKSGNRVNPDGMVPIGTEQVDTYASHSHPIATVETTSHAHLDGGSSFRVFSAAHARDPSNIGSSVVGTTETRPKNVSLLYCIKL